MTNIPKIFVFILLFIQTIHSLELKKSSMCQTAIGMQSGAIPDSAISVSSSYDVNTVGPKASRARTEQYGGAWCPLNDVQLKATEWIEIGFGNLTYLTQVETQGRFDNGRGKEYAEYYILMYTRMDNVTDNRTIWIEYKPKTNENNSTWIRANRNTYIGEIHLLNPPIVAKRLRFYPVSKQIRSICMRVEIYGCPFSDGLISYSMTQGRTDVNSLGDDTYDGQYIPSKNLLINGLGQLSDGITGTEEISVINGYQPWIGWSNETNGYITIRFQFDTIRQINRMSIHTNNLFSRDILIFKKAIISFSKHGKNYSNTIVYEHIRDDIFEIARPVLIELQNQIAKYVRLDLYFDSKWLLISEITFDSQIHQEETMKIKEKISFSGNDVRKRYREIHPTTTLKSLRMQASPMITMELSLAFFIGALLAVSVLLTVVLIWIVRRKKKLQFQKLTEKPCNNSSCYTYPTLPIREFHDLNAPVTSALDDQEYAIPDVNFYSTFSPQHNIYSPRSLRPPPPTGQSASINAYPTLKSIPHCCVHQSPPPPPLIIMPPVQDAPSVEAACGNSLMMTIGKDIPQSLEKELNAEDLVLVKKIGDGLFGSIHLAELKTEKQLVVVKSLNENVEDQQKTFFSKEIQLLSSLNHANICSLLGTINGQRTWAVFEYDTLDLYQYLRQQLIPLDNSSASSFLLSLACQLVSGMKYLSSLQIIHRDLAARNCLISTDKHQLRISDIAMAKFEYGNDYARIGHFQTRIAIRWAAWESIFLNHFSVKSDAWSFAVTLYELFTYARQRPYHTLTNEQLVQRFASLSQTYVSSPLITRDVQLPQPELCSKEIYDMMCECWQRDAQRRPTFADMHIFLLGKAAGSAALVSTGL